MQSPKIEKISLGSESISKFIERISIQNKNTARQYHSRLLMFERFVKQQQQQYKIKNVDILIQKLRTRELDPYEVINDFCLFLKNNYNIGSATFRDRIVTIKTFFEYNDIELSPRQFKLKVRFPKLVTRNKEAIDKEDIIKILNGCSNLRLKTYVIFLASSGARAVEALSIRNKDLDLESNPPKVTIRGEHNKTKVDRYVFLTQEMKGQFQIWDNFKYRTRRICYKDKQKGKYVNEYRSPKKSPNDLVFLVNNVDNPNPEVLYVNLGTMFLNVLDRIGLDSREDSNTHRRKITFHSFRRFVKTTISDLGFQDYSEWFLGHAGSTYWRKKDNEKAQIFKKIEPYLTFLDIQQLERKGADLETKITELQEINQILRDRETRRDEMMERQSKRLTQLEERFLELTNAENTERKLDREFELEQDRVKKDQRFDKFLKLQRDTIRKRGDLERHLQETIKK